MAIASGCVWEIRTTGSDTNGGGYVSGGVDYSQQDAAQLAVTDVVANGTTTLTSATAGFTANMVGNIIYLQGGTGALAATRRQITAFTNSTTITVDATVAAGTGITGNVGGAVASPGEACRNATARNDFWIKAGTYTISSTTANISTGRVQLPGGQNTGADQCRFIGYSAARGDLTPTSSPASRPLLQVAAAGVTTITVLDMVNDHCTVEQINIDGQVKTAIRGITATGTNNSLVRFCRVINCTNNAVVANNRAKLFGVEATGCTTTAPAIACAGFAFGCYAHDNTINGFGDNSGTGIFTYCIADTNTGATTDGFRMASAGAVQFCSSYNNGRHGFTIETASFCMNNVAVSNGGYGFTTTSAGVRDCLVLQNCGGYNNTTANVDTTNIPRTEGFQTLSGDPFANASGGDFTLNNTAGAGFALQAAGFPYEYPNSATTALPTIGASPVGAGSPGTGGGVSAHAFIG